MFNAIREFQNILYMAPIPYIYNRSDTITDNNLSFYNPFLLNYNNCSKINKNYCFF